MPFPRNSLMKSLVLRHRYPFGFCDSEFLNAFCMSECLSMLFILLILFLYTVVLQMAKIKISFYVVDYPY